MEILPGYMDEHPIHGDFNMCSLGVVTLPQGKDLRLNPLDITPYVCGRNMPHVSKEVPSIGYYP